jgi:hypothetical protein
MAYQSLHVLTNVTVLSIFESTKEYSKFLLAECTVLRRAYDYTRPHINIVRFEVSALCTFRDGVLQL